MAVLLAFAFVSGMITILSPCILPVLPIVLSGGVSGGRARPFGVIAGFAASFTVFTLTLSTLVQAFHVPADALRAVAVALIVAFGLVMLVPKLRDGFELLASGLANWSRPRAGAVSAKPRLGFWSGLPIGLSLGLVWTPCVGPIMASVISLALARQVDGGSALIALSYTLGTSIPMLAVMIGGRALLARIPWLARNAAGIQKGFGVVMIVVGVAIGFGWDRRFQTAVLAALPGYGAGLTAIELAAPVQGALAARESVAVAQAAATDADAVFSGAPGMVPQKKGVPGDYGRAPSFVTRGQWFNTEAIAAPRGETAAKGSPPLDMDGLRGKVVLVDFWTYSCINCVRTIPYLKAWHQAYKDRGLVIVGVHTPEFEFEKSPSNVARAIKELGVAWPVVLDNDYAQWNAYGNHYWPAHYFIDAKGRVRYFHFGEGEYDASERVIKALLEEAGASVGRSVSKPAPDTAAGTAETYLGYARGRGFASAVHPVPDAVAEYRPARPPGNGEWNLEGKWTIAGQYVVPERSGSLALGFQARNVYLVIEPEAPGGSIEVRVDGRPGRETADVRNGVLAPAESRLYHLVALDQPGGHVLTLHVTGRLRLFAFTFG